MTPWAPWQKQGETMKVTIEDYLSQHMLGNEHLCTPEVMANAAETVRRDNLLLAAMAADGVELAPYPLNGTMYSSGWRPPAVNASIENAAPRSHHITGCASDKYDPHGQLDRWCLENLDKLAEIGLWLESPRHTPGWNHTQIKPPRSGARIFIP